MTGLTNIVPSRRLGSHEATGTRNFEKYHSLNVETLHFPTLVHVKPRFFAEKLRYFS